MPFVGYQGPIQVKVVTAGLLLRHTTDYERKRDLRDRVEVYHTIGTVARRGRNTNQANADKLHLPLPVQAPGAHGRADAATSPPNGATHKLYIHLFDFLG